MPRFVKFRQPDTVVDQGEDDMPVTSPGQPVLVNVEMVRNVTPRRPDRGSGTRIAFANSAAVIVAESFDEVMAALSPTMN